MVMNELLDNVRILGQLLHGQRIVYGREVANHLLAVVPVKLMALGVKFMVLRKQLVETSIVGRRNAIVILIWLWLLKEMEHIDLITIAHQERHLAKVMKNCGL